MGVGDCVADRKEKFQNLAQAERRAILINGDAIDVLHHQIRPAVAGVAGVE